MTYATSGSFRPARTQPDIPKEFREVVISSPFFSSAPPADFRKPLRLSSQSTYRGEKEVHLRLVGNFNLVLIDDERTEVMPLSFVLTHSLKNTDIRNGSLDLRKVAAVSTDK